MKDFHLPLRQLVVIAATFVIAWGYGPSLIDHGSPFGFKAAYAKSGGGGGGSGGGGGFGSGDNRGEGGGGSGGGSDINQDRGDDHGIYGGSAMNASELGKLNAANAAGYALGHPNPRSVVGQISAYRDSVQQGGLTTLEDQRLALSKISNKPVSDAELARVNELLGLSTPSP